MLELFFRDEAQEVLAVVDWGQNLSFHLLNGKQVGKDRLLSYDPCAVDWFSKGEYLAIGGADKQVESIYKAQA